MVWRMERDDVDGVADVALYVIAGTIGVADFLSAYAADEEAEFGLDLV